MLATIMTSGRLEEVVSFHRWALEYKDTNVTAISPRLDTHPELNGTSYITFTGTDAGIQHVVRQANDHGGFLGLTIQVKMVPATSDEPANVLTTSVPTANDRIREVLGGLTAADRAAMTRANNRYGESVRAVVGTAKKDFWSFIDSLAASAEGSLPVPKSDGQRRSRSDATDKPSSS